MKRVLLIMGLALGLLAVPQEASTNSEKKLLIVEYGDFQCPYCQKAYHTLMQVLDHYGDKVEWEWKNFPLDFHSAARPAAMVAECARDQGKFREVHDAIFTFDPRSLNEELLIRTAKEKVPDPEALDRCYKSGVKNKVIEDDMAEASKLGVTGTPAFLINGKMISGAQPFEAFQRIIDVALDPSKGSKMFVVTPPGCKSKCAPEDLIRDLMGEVFQGVVRVDISLDSPKGQEIKTAFNLTGVPALVFEKSIEKEASFGRVNPRLTQAQGLYLLSPQVVPPTLYLTGLPNYTFDLGLGPATAPVTIIEYTDFMSARTAAISQAIIEITKKFPGQVRHVVRPIPGTKTQQSKLLNQAAFCLGEQGKFWKSYNLLPLSGEDATVADLTGLAKIVAADTGKFNACLKNLSQFGARESAYMKDVTDLSLKPGSNLFIGRQRLEDPSLFRMLDAVEGILKAKAKGKG